jgi:hypothetical protein
MPIRHFHSNLKTPLKQTITLLHRASMDPDLTPGADNIVIYDNLRPEGGVCDWRIDERSPDLATEPRSRHGNTKTWRNRGWGVTERTSDPYLIPGTRHQTLLSCTI